MYPITNAVKALFEAEQTKVLRITGKPMKKEDVSVGPSNVVTVDDAVDIPAKDITIGIEPVQSGSGDPSPTNVRPISGWTVANVVVSPTADAQDGTTYPISWQAEAGTVYGGTLDVTTGLLTVDRAMVDLGTLDWQRNGDRFQFYSSNIIPAVSDKSGKNVVCSGYASGNAYSYGSNNFTICIAESNPRVFVTDDRFTDGASFKAAMSGVQLVYELATPQTYQLTPTEVKLLLGENNVWADTGDTTLTYRPYADLIITDDNVMEDSFQIDRYSCNGEKLEVGTAISAQLTSKLDNGEGQFDDIIFEGTELFVEIGVADWSLTNPTITWVPCGYFTPDVQPRRMATISITALDRMTRFDSVPPSLTPWTTASGETMTDSRGNVLYFLRDVQFPASVTNLIRRVALLCDVPFSQSLSSFPNANLVIDQMPALEQTVTYRNIIQWCAGIMGANAWIDWTGSLRFSWYNNTTGYISTTQNRYNSDLHENSVTITGVSYTNANNVKIESGTDEYTLDLSGNYMAAAKISTILPNVNNRLNGFTYRPFTASVVNAPYLWPMDIVTFKDKDGNSYSSALTNVTFGLNGTTVLQSKGESAETNSRVKPSSVNSETAYMIERAAQVARELDQSLDQEGIFNRLTDGGEVQGLLLYNGKVYLNAEYIRAGTLAANLLLASILTIGGSTDGNGSIQIYDKDGVLIGRWDKNGISVLKGSIAGPSITLGGVDNTSGTLTVKDASNTTIGTWDNNGLTLYKGSIAGPSVTLGGSNNKNGTLTINNASNRTIGTWNKDGISITSGEISLRLNDEKGLNIGRNGDLAIGAKPDDISDFFNNKCAFQVGRGGEVKSVNFRVFAKYYEDQGGDGIYYPVLNIQGNHLPNTSWNAARGVFFTITNANDQDPEYIMHLSKVQVNIYKPLVLDNALGVEYGGTGAKNPADARTNLGITAANIGAKVTQSTVSDPWPSGEAVAFIDSISQNAQGVISPTKKWVRNASQSESGLMSANDKAKLDGIASGAQVTSVNNKTGAVSLSASDVGAVAKSGDTMTGNLTVTGNITTPYDIFVKRSLLVYAKNTNKAGLLIEGNNTKDTSYGVERGAFFYIADSNGAYQFAMHLAQSTATFGNVKAGTTYINELHPTRSDNWLDFHGSFCVKTDLLVEGSFTVNGTKSRSVTTQEYGKRLLYCYETPTPMFGDVGEGVIGEDGLCYITLEAVFAQTVVSNQYQVYLQKYGPGDCWVKERKGAYFIVEGTPGLSFGWEVKAKQRDYDQLRIERYDDKFTVPTQTYGEDAAKHIDDIQKERISA
jgi:hypothetical protein